MRRNGQPVLPIIYAPPQFRIQKYVPILIVACCGVWVFAMGSLLERLEPAKTLPMQKSTTMARRTGIVDKDTPPSPVALMKVVEEPTRVLEEASRKDKEAANNVPMQRPTVPEGRAQPVNNSANLKIPNVMIFTHAVNLLTYLPTHDTSDKTADQLAEQEELLVLQKNVQASIAMHPNAQVRFLTDQDCIQSLQSVLGENAPLIQYFEKETKGMYKADICRGAALWETGGIYLDVDVGLRMPLTDVLEANTTFATTLVHKDSQHIGGFFQAFMASTPRHAILERYLELFLEHYQGKRPVKKGPLGVILLRQAFDDVVLQKHKEVRAINGKPFDVMVIKHRYFELGPQNVDTTHYGRIQIWQEFLYVPKLFPNVVPAPTWGTRRACHFLVATNRNFPLTVPMYSRIAGSRMCPVNEVKTEK
jgi:Glycosyltransferase sugar-binding region containing DXD motif